MWNGRQRVIEVLNTALFTNSPNGTTTNGLALSADEKTLFIANADNNCLAVFNVECREKADPEGFIPVGWYPTNVKIAGNKIFVTNGKGFTSFANPAGPNPYSREKRKWYTSKGRSQRLKSWSISGR